MNVVTTGGATPAILAELQKEDAAKNALTAQLAGSDHLASIVSLDGTRIEQALVEKVADVKRMLGGHIPQTRQMLRKLVSGRIVCTPFNDARGRGYVLQATGTYAGLLGETVPVKDGQKGGTRLAINQRKILPKVPALQYALSWRLFPFASACGRIELVPAD